MVGNAMSMAKSRLWPIISLTGINIIKTEKTANYRKANTLYVCLFVFKLLLGDFEYILQTWSKGR